MNTKTFFINPQVKKHIQENKLVFDWVNFSFIALLKLVALIGIPVYYSFHSFSLAPWIWAIGLYWATGLGITAGYHRLFSHKAYKAHPLIENFLLVLGAMAVQNSALKWSSDHRYHHQYTDTSKDPYNIQLGFLWAHILWIFFAPPKTEAEKSLAKSFSIESLQKQFPNAKDLVLNPRVRFQHRYSKLGGPVLSLLLPTLLGFMVGDPVGYLLIAGIVRIIFVHQSTFLINSLAHILGEKTHSVIQSARDNFLCSFFAFGEGYHNFHHTYPNDFRNGHRFYQFDPTKWLILCLSGLGLATHLKKQKAIL